MIVTKVDYYLDGGTCEIFTDQGKFFIDGRLNSDTEGEIYDDYPDDGEIINGKNKEIADALRQYLIQGVDFYKEAIEMTIDKLVI